MTKILITGGTGKLGIELKNIYLGIMSDLKILILQNLLRNKGMI